MNFTSIRLACDRIVSYFFTFITDEQENCVLEAEVVAGSCVRWSNCWWWWLCVLVLGGWWSMSFSGIILRSFQHFKGRLGLLEKKKNMGLYRDTFGIHWQNSPLGGEKKMGCSSLSLACKFLSRIQFGFSANNKYFRLPFISFQSLFTKVTCMQYSSLDSRC